MGINRRQQNHSGVDLENRWKCRRQNSDGLLMGVFDRTVGQVADLWRMERNGELCTRCGDEHEDIGCRQIDAQ